MQSNVTACRCYMFVALIGLVWVNVEIHQNHRIASLFRKSIATHVGKQKQKLKLKLKQQQQQQQQQEEEQEQEQETSLLEKFLFPEKPGLETLPPWLQEYVKWHEIELTKLWKKAEAAAAAAAAAGGDDEPQQHILSIQDDDDDDDDDDGPPLMIRICPYRCAGLHDRMSPIPDFLYRAYREKRILFIKWYHTHYSLESFLLPRRSEQQSPIINFTLPHVHNITDTPEKLMRFASQQKGDRILVLTTREDDKKQKDSRIPQDTLQRPNFQTLFHFLFTPSPPLKSMILDAFHQMNLTTSATTADVSSSPLSSSSSSSLRQYNALHLRVRHPAQYGRASDMKMDSDAVTGFPWNVTGDRTFAIETAIKALQCTNKHWNNSDNNNLPIFIYSDTSRLVRYLLQESQDDAVLAQKLVARNSTIQSVHLDSVMAVDGPSSVTSARRSYASVFVDLWVAAHAQNIGIGVGNFGLLAQRIGEPRTVLVHTRSRTGVLAQRWSYRPVAEDNQTVVEMCENIIQ